VSETFVFHKLKVWHLAKDMVKEIYKLTKEFPSDEKFDGLVKSKFTALVHASTSSARTYFQ
jgi:hypothetical protein